MDGVTSCVLNITTKSPGPPNNDLVIWLGGVAAIVLFVAVGLVVYHWVDKRDWARDSELLEYKRQVNVLTQETNRLQGLVYRAERGDKVFDGEI